MYRHIHLSTESEEWLEGLTNQAFFSNFAASSSAACKKVAEDGVAQAHPYRVCVVLNPLCSAQGSRGIITFFGGRNWRNVVDGIQLVLQGSSPLQTRCNMG